MSQVILCCRHFYPLRVTATVTYLGLEQRMEMGPDSKGLIELIGEARVTIYPGTPAVTDEKDTHEEGGREVFPGADLRSY